MKDTWAVPTSKLRRRLGRVAESAILLPAVLILVLGVIWSTTLNLIKVERTAAELAATVSSQELAATYEAQVVRALREIDQTLKFVKYAYELEGKQGALQELNAKLLLPPALLFVVSIADRNGDVVASTRPMAMSNVADQDYFQAPRNVDALLIGRPPNGPSAGEGKLHFSRRLESADGTFAGIVIVSVDAAYFVSGYETSKLGEHGVLGILGIDGVFRARRTGNAVSAGDTFDFSAVVPASNEAQSETVLSTNVWDGVRRYTSARQLHEFPLAVIAGLSADEQLAATRRNMRTYLWRASGGSLVLILIAAVMGRMNQRLAASRRRAVEEQLAHAARVEYVAYHDDLTALPNRSLFNKLLDQSIHQADCYSRPLGVLAVDLDGFRTVNDSFGLAAGDILLRQAASRLQCTVRNSDTVARVGGDEFLLLLEGIAGMADCVTLAGRLIETLGRPFDVLGHPVELSGSVGIAIYPDHGRRDELVTHADTARHAAKRSGGGTYALFDPNMEAGAAERLSLLNDLRRAVELKQLTLHYQPKIDGRRGQIRGVEALLRWHHPERGMVSPAVFIPIAERFGLIHGIGSWVIDEACRQMQAWADVGMRMRVAVNVSAQQLRKGDLVARIEQALDRHQVGASQLLCEITESVVMEDVSTTQRVFEGLGRIGVYLSIDDFGTGYSSLSYLRQLPAKQLKVDRSFVNDLESSSDARAIVDAVIRLAHALGLLVVAEGVETAGQRDILLQLGCDELQGYFFAKPMQADKLLAWAGGRKPEGAVDFSPSVVDETLSGRRGAAVSSVE